MKRSADPIDEKKVLDFANSCKVLFSLSFFKVTFHVIIKYIGIL